MEEQKKPTIKLIIQIPCLNERETLAATLGDLPTQIDGIDQIERIVIDDGSSDGTADLAQELGVEHVIRLPKRRGLANAFNAGIRKAIALGADIIVNTDGDNQYQGQDVKTLLEPILNGSADLAVGERPIQDTQHFSWLKKRLQKWGSRFVSQMSGAQIPDAPSGFRALTRDAALRLNLFSNYTYTLEMLIQAGRSGMSIVSVPIRTNPPTRPSRLMGSTLGYVFRSIVTTVRIFIVYRPFRFFLLLGMIPFAVAIFLSFRWIYFQYMDIGGGRVQSLILAAILYITSGLAWALGIIADLLSINRTILEENQYRLRRRDLLDDNVDGSNG